jgi:sulfite exporter TauE/SafE
MPDGGLTGLLLLGFGLGLTHAFDADHIMAVTSLASREPGWRRTLRFCGAWAVGHGLTLLTVGALVLGVGWQLPEGLYATAEGLVGVVLVALGLWLWWDLWRRRVRLTAHRHGGVSHVHLVADSDSHGGRWADHSPVMVGILHGLAGAAPLMALLPSIQAGGAWAGLGYLLVFSAGVLVSMAGFGVAFGTFQDWVARRGTALMNALRLVVGGLAVGLGGMWLAGAA